MTADKACMECGDTESFFAHTSIEECESDLGSPCPAVSEHHAYAPGRYVLISEEDFSRVKDALRYAADDYAERASFEEKFEQDEDESEADDFAQAADEYSATLTRLEDRS